MSKLPYGYTLGSNGILAINTHEASVIKGIYNSYLSGKSLGKIADMLFEQQVSSPNGNDRWTRASIDKLLSNQKYIPFIIDLEQFLLAQIEKNARSNVDMDSGKRIPIRYTSL